MKREQAAWPWGIALLAVTTACSGGGPGGTSTGGSSGAATASAGASSAGSSASTSSSGTTGGASSAGSTGTACTPSTASGGSSGTGGASGGSTPWNTLQNTSLSGSLAFPLAFGGETIESGDGGSPSVVIVGLSGSDLSSACGSDAGTGLQNASQSANASAFLVFSGPDGGPLGPGTFSLPTTAADLYFSVLLGRYSGRPVVFTTDPETGSATLTQIDAQSAAGSFQATFAPTTVLSAMPWDGGTPPDGGRLLDGGFALVPVGFFDGGTLSGTFEVQFCDYGDLGFDLSGTNGTNGAGGCNGS